MRNVLETQLRPSVDATIREAIAKTSLENEVKFLKKDNARLERQLKEVEEKLERKLKEVEEKLEKERDKREKLFQWGPPQPVKTRYVSG